MLKAENLTLVKVYNYNPVMINEIYSKKDNLIFKWISESKNETDEQSEHEIRAFLRNDLNLDDNQVTY